MFHFARVRCLRLVCFWVSVVWLVFLLVLLNPTLTSKIDAAYSTSDEIGVLQLNELNSHQLSSNWSIGLVNNSGTFYEVVQSFHLAFNSLRIAHSIISDVTLYVKDNNTLFVVFDINQPLPNKYVVYNMEQMDVDVRELKQKPEWIEKHRQAVAVWDYSQENMKRWNEHGIQSIWLPYGTSDSLTFPWFDETKSRVGVAFIGYIDKLYYLRRTNMLQNIRKLKPEMEIKDSRCWHQCVRDRYRASKVALNIHFHSGNTILEVQRLFPMIQAGLLVVTEASNDAFYDSRMEGLVDFVNFSASEFAYRAQQLLDLPDSEVKKLVRERVRELNKRFNMTAFIEARFHQLFQ